VYFIACQIITRSQLIQLPFDLKNYKPPSRYCSYLMLSVVDWVASCCLVLPHPLSEINAWRNYRARSSADPTSPNLLHCVGIKVTEVGSKDALGAAQSSHVLILSRQQISSKFIEYQPWLFLVAVHPSISILISIRSSAFTENACVIKCAPVVMCLVLTWGPASVRDES